ncbi:30S ribosomal protein S4 [Candidatus Woesearchaeota archaeon]|nr:30S ribosomal protein S4 [Candidatus Woesearchaeota archaeon]
MGDPRKIRKKYETPRHPWVGSRITEERELKQTYGLRNKTEAWRMATTLKQYKDRVKKLLARSDKQAQVEQQQLLDSMTRLGIIKKGATFDDILSLSIEAVMDRRLQTVLIKKNLARTPKQARQMVTHRHITIDGQVVTSPSKLVTLEEESQLGFAVRSGFINESHPERLSEEELLKRKAKADANAKKEATDAGEESTTFAEKAIEQAEVLAGEKKVDSVKDAVKEEKAEKEAPKPAPKEKKEEKTPEKPAPKEDTTPETPKETPKEEPKVEKPKEEAKAEAPVEEKKEEKAPKTPTPKEEKPEEKAEPKKEDA